MIKRFLAVLVSMVSVVAFSCATPVKEVDTQTHPADNIDPQVHGEEEIRALLDTQGNFSSYNRASGLVTDLYRQQKLRFAQRNPEGRNVPGATAEELINEAALYASQENYSDSFKTLGKALDIIVASLDDLDTGN